MLYGQEDTFLKRDIIVGLTKHIEYLKKNKVHPCDIKQIEEILLFMETGKVPDGEKSETLQEAIEDWKSLKRFAPYRRPIY